MFLTIFYEYSGMFFTQIYQFLEKKYQIGENGKKTNKNFWVGLEVGVSWVRVNKHIFFGGGTLKCWVLYSAFPLLTKALYI